MTKGQMIAVDQMIVFLMGIIILTSVAYSYNTAQRVITDATTEDQFLEVAEFTLNNIIFAYNSGKNNNRDIEVLIDIPKELSSQAYEINLTSERILVKSFIDEKTNVTIPVGNINESLENLRGSAVSPGGKIKVNYVASSNIIILSDE